MNKFRSEYDTIAEIIDFTQEPKTITKIVYKLFSNHKQIKKYVKYMMEKGLLEMYTGSQYISTEKGAVFLFTLSAIKEMFKL
jgi:predicted transcriptional regulator